MENFCPLDDIICPYYDYKLVSCELESPEEECDDYMYFYSYDDEEE